MEIPKLDTSQGAGSSLFTSWKAIRDVANVMFVIGFMVVVYSQITGGGMSNYTIKRMLPRLVVAAVLVNISFYICATAIDISNILGKSLKDVLSNLAPPVSPTFSTFGHVASLALIAGGAVAISMAVFELFPILVAGIISLIITILILLARQAIVIVLVILSPLAFVANMLPNTQKWFNRWWTTFFTMLMIYPIVGVIYGGSRIASGVISQSAPNDGDMAIVFAAFALGVQIIPFFMVPILMRLSGNILNRFTGIVNNPNSGMFDAAKKRSRRWADNKYKEREVKSLNGGNNAMLRRYHQSKAKKTAMRNFQKGHGMNFARAQYLSQEDIASDTADKATAGLSGERKKERMQALQAMASQVRIQLDIENIDAAEAEIEELMLGGHKIDLRDRALNGKDEDSRELTEEERAAAVRKLATEGTIDDIHSLIEKTKDSNSASLRRSLVEGISKNSAAKNAVHLSGSALNSIRDGNSGGVGGLYDRAAAAGKYTASSLSVQSAKSIKGMQTYMSAESKNIVKTQYGVIKDNALNKNDATALNNMTSGAHSAMKGL